MLTIYDRQKIAVGRLGTSGAFGNYAEVSEVTIKKRLNSDYNLTFLLPMNSEKYDLVELEGLIKCEEQLYVIKGIKRSRQGLSRTVIVTCQHIMRRMMDISIPYSSAQAEALGKDISYFTNLISSATNGIFTFQIMDTLPLKDVYKWGYSNCLTAFQDIINAYGVEFVPDNYNIKIYQKINIDNGMQYRFKKNIIDNTFESKSDALCTRMTGTSKDSLSIIDLPSSNLTAGELALLNAVPGAIVGGLIKVPYLISQYVANWATPDNAYFDSSFEDTSIDASDTAGKLLLLDQIRKKLAAAEIPEFQVQMNAADLWKIDSSENRPQLGETVYAIDKDMELPNLTARIMEMTEYPFDPSKHGTTTLANYILKDYKDIMADLNASKKLLEGIVTNKKVNTSELETFAKQAIIDINNAKTQIIWDTRGEILQSKTNALHQVILTAEGIIISTDGGVTANTAITATGVAAQYIVGLLGSFASIRASQIDVSGGRIIAGQIDATSLHVNSANIDGTITAGRLNVNSGVTLLDGFNDVNGGVLKVYDNSGNLNVKLGVESGTASNVGGTFVLYNDAPSGTSGFSTKQRVEAGILTARDYGLFTLRDTNAKARVTLEADDVSVGPYIGVRDSSENLKSYLTATSGFINSFAILTTASTVNAKFA